MPLLQISDLEKAYRSPDGETHRVVAVSSFELEARQQLALSGESGSGKTTFLNLIAGIIPADSGSIRIGEREVTAMSESDRDRFRGAEMGYIFQTFNLLQGFTCVENVILGMSFGGPVDRTRAKQLLDRVGLADRMRHYPRQLSTGQQQRVAVARALASRPRLVLADEPTGNLDAQNAREVLALIRETCEETDAALLLVSHDRDILQDFELCRDLRDINTPQGVEVGR